MTSVYNLLREACGISQAEPAEHVHGTRLDTVKSWSSDRRPAPGWAINQLQSLSRRIRRAGEVFAREEVLVMLQATPSLTLGVPATDADAQARGFPSMAAMMQAIAVTLSLLPDDADIRLESCADIPHVKLPRLDPDEVLPTRTDRDVLAEMTFADGRYYTAGNMNRRKFERLEEIGWIEGESTSMSDVEYRLTRAGSFERALINRGRLMLAHPPTVGFQSQVHAGPGPLPPIFLRAGEQVFLDREHTFTVSKIEGEVVRALLPDGATILLSAPAHMLR